jgi:hypothetical protein
LRVLSSGCRSGMTNSLWVATGLGTHRNAPDVGAQAADDPHFSGEKHEEQQLRTTTGQQLPGLNQCMSFGRKAMGLGPSPVRGRAFTNLQ